METYIFTVIVRILHKGERIDECVIRGARASSEFEARRIVLDQLITTGFQVKKIEKQDEHRQVE